ncbi:hypothetical protein JKP88DRAFT_283529 [Tribonema minus]|uniref:Uncharacterized protein n=1 Tax=Tribonema minus TaxID=303371 RepID=A0A835YH85_9STRA|nr:hypothetical protein JKP88DRAFT_283529 [Tribonema minus]
MSRPRNTRATADVQSGAAVPLTAPSADAAANAATTAVGDEHTAHQSAAAAADGGGAGISAAAAASSAETMCTTPPDFLSYAIVCTAAHAAGSTEELDDAYAQAVRGGTVEHRPLRSGGARVVADLHGYSVAMVQAALRRLLSDAIRLSTPCGSSSSSSGGGGSGGGGSGSGSGAHDGSFSSAYRLYQQPLGTQRDSSTADPDLNVVLVTGVGTGVVAREVRRFLMALDPPVRCSLHSRNAGQTIVDGQDLVRWSRSDAARLYFVSRDCE